jgi:NifU-like protein involved in Fe-S cluster formation
VAPTVAACVADPVHAGALDGADGVGEAAGGERLRVRIGLWLARGLVARARFRATSCASLIAYSEAACGLLESGEPPAAVDAAALRARVAGVHPGHRDRAELVAAAIGAARAAASKGGAP